MCGPLGGGAPGREIGQLAEAGIGSIESDDLRHYPLGYEF
jgi:hypothetical protein